MKKKVISMLLAAAMATTVFAGCGSGDSQDSSAGTSEESSSEESATEESGEETASAEPDTTYGTSQEGKFVVGFDQEFRPWDLWRGRRVHRI